MTEYKLSGRAWLLFAAIAFLVWALNAAVEDSRPVALIAGPLLTILWLAGVALLDHWVQKNE
jgi:hypothetical protein